MKRHEPQFSVGEQEIIEGLVQTFGITYIEAVEEVVKQKRELAYYHKRLGNEELSEQLLKEIGDK